MRVEFERRTLIWRWGLWILTCLGISLGVWISFAPLLQFNFTGWDIIVHVKTASERVAEPARFFLESLTPDTGWYRPFSGLSYGIDYMLWGLNPVGYHFTDVFLHWGVSLGVLLLGYQVTRRLWAAALGGILFAVHPIVVPVIINSAQRHDTLMTLGVVGTLLWLDQALRFHNRSRIVYWVGAWASFAVAVGAKETGLLALPLVLWLAWRERRGTTLGRFVLPIAPFLFIALTYIVVRQIVVRGLQAPDEFGTTWYFTLPLLYLQELTLPGARWGWLNWVLLAAILTAVGALALLARNDSKRVTWMVLFGIWFMVPMALYVAVHVSQFSNRYGYVILVPVVLGMTLLLTIPDKGAHPIRRIVSVAAKGIVVVPLLGLLPFTPLFGLPTGITERELAVGNYLRQLDQALGNLPERTSVDLRNVPPPLFLRDKVQAWLDLKWRAKHFQLGTISNATSARGQSEVTVVQLSSNHVLIQASYTRIKKEK